MKDVLLQEKTGKLWTRKSPDQLQKRLTATVFEQMKKERKVTVGLEQTPTILEQMKRMVHEVTKIVAGLEKG